MATGTSSIGLGDGTSTFSEEAEVVDDKPVIFESEDSEPSVPSHNKTGMSQYRRNPAILLQEVIAGIELEESQDIFEKSVPIAKRYSTDSYDDYRNSAEKVRVLLQQFATMLKDNMPAHAAQALHSQEVASPEVLLIQGIFQAAQEDYKAAINLYKRSLRSNFPGSKKPGTGEMNTMELRVNVLNQLGIVLCLSDNFSDGERYFQFALEESSKDEKLITRVMDKYSELSLSAGEAFVRSSPLDRFFKALDKEQKPSGDDSNEIVDEERQTAVEQISTEKEQGETVDHEETDGPPDVGESEVAKPSEDAAAAEAADPRSGLSWFPTSKEELLDYSAAFIEMMMMGIEMVKHQQTTRRKEENEEEEAYEPKDHSAHV